MALETLASIVPFRDDDLLVTLGDYVDRGPDSRGVLEWLIARYATGKLVPLCGNHEIMMLQGRDDVRNFRYWVEMGGGAALDSYGAFRSDPLASIPDSHWQFLDYETRRYYETDTHFFVHATARPDWPLGEQSDEVLFWEKFDYPPPHQSGKIMVCGHTAQRSGLPLDIGHAVCIDTWAYGGGWLTCLDPVTGEYWQANQRGEIRRDWLQPRAG